MRLRRCVVERPFAELKYRIFGHPRFLLRGPRRSADGNHPSDHGLQPETHDEGAGGSQFAGDTGLLSGAGQPLAQHQSSLENDVREPITRRARNQEFRNRLLLYEAVTKLDVGVKRWNKDSVRETQ